MTPLIRLLQLNVIAAAFNLSQLNHSHLRFKCSGDLSMALELAHVEIDRGVIPLFHCIGNRVLMLLYGNNIIVIRPNSIAMQQFALLLGHHHHASS